MVTQLALSLINLLYNYHLKNHQKRFPLSIFFSLDQQQTMSVPMRAVWVPYIFAVDSPMSSPWIPFLFTVDFPNEFHGVTFIVFCRYPQEFPLSFCRYRHKFFFAFPLCYLSVLPCFLVVFAACLFMRFLCVYPCARIAEIFTAICSFLINKI